MNILELEYKKNFSAAQRQWQAFWSDQAQRPLLSLVAPKKQGQPLATRPNNYGFGRQGTVEQWLDQYEFFFENTLFLAEALPIATLSFAPDHFSALLGAEIEMPPEGTATAWMRPFVEDWEKTDLRLQQEGYWWHRTLEFIRGFRQRFDGRALLSPPQIQGGLDCLSAIRGNQKLLMDLIDCPEQVEAALAKVNQVIRQVRAAFARELDLETYGSVNRHLFYSPDAMIDVPQCDFSCMIDPAMFSRFQMPALSGELADLGACDYHLDGPGAIQHLEAICSLDKIAVIQWQPGAGAAAEQDWEWLYRRIDSLGRGLLLVRQAGLEYGKKLWGKLKTRKIFIDYQCRDLEEAQAIIDYFE